MALPGIAEPTPLDPGWERYAAAVAFPPYRYVPGRSPHPRRHPDGHQFGHREEPPALFDPDAWATTVPYLHGIDLYNYAYWWECHEALEALWNAAGRGTVPGQFLQGLIQAAAGHLNHYLGRSRGCARLWSAALGRLTEVPDHYMGVGVREFAGRLARHAADPSGVPIPLIRLAIPATESGPRVDVGG